MITFVCDGCRQKLNAADNLAGRRMKCPGCGQPVEIPAAGGVESTPAPVADKSSLDFDVAPPRYSAQRPRKKSSHGLLVGSLLVVCLALLGGYAFFQFRANQPRLTLPVVNPETVQELQPVTFSIAAGKPAGWNGEVQYELVAAPSGAQLEPRDGKFSWTPTEEQGPGDYDFTIRASAADGSAQAAETSFHFEVAEFNQPPEITPIDDLTATIKQPLEFRVEARDSDIPASPVTLRMSDGAPPDATFDPATGQFRWTPQKSDEGRALGVIFEASEGEDGLTATEIVHIRVEGAPGPSETILEEWRAAGADVQFREYGSTLPIEGSAQVVTLDGQPVTLIEFDNDDSRKAEEAKIRGAVQPNENSKSGPTQHFYQRERLIAVYEGDDAEVLKRLSDQLPDAFATGRLPAPNMVEEPDTSPVTAATETPTANAAQTELDDRVYRLYEYKLLLVPKRYKELRKAYSDFFEKTQTSAIEAAFGEQRDEMSAWLNEHPDIKEELYTAIDPDADNVQEALRLFRELKQQFPEQIVPYAQLAIAIAVTWDDENNRGVYDYAHHQRRVHADMPDDLIGAVENFRYFAGSENVMQGRAQYLPWEFLAHIVNHRTPLGERQWAVTNYLASRVGVGKCYSDVPYDQEMLRTDDLVCKMDGKSYTLANLREFGGVCAQQADFAARVGKSLGVPAAYVRGEGNSGGLHAWVMWVELKQVTPQSINFDLLSHGRYRIDQYYVGELFDPQTNQLITDRQLELRLHVIGVNPLAHRQAALVMRAYPMIRERAELDATQQLVFLRKVADLCPGLPETWEALAQMSREGLIEKKHSRQMDRSLELFFTTFAQYPDFTWTIFDDLIAHHPQAKDRLDAYARLVALYESAGRPDLACEARLKMSDDQVKNDKSQAAIEGLAYTIQKFPGEGRYVPRMLDRLEQICATITGADQQLAQFYQQFLPTIPTHRGDSVSEYCVATFRRGIKFFESHNQPQLAKQFQDRLGKIESGG